MVGPNETKKLTLLIGECRRTFGEPKRMRYLGSVFVFISLTSGVASAYYWYRSSKIKVSPAWKQDLDGDKEKNMMAWVAGNMIALTKSGIYNRTASLWATVAAVAAAAASAVSVLPK
jgi:hypothetical protein